MIDCFFKITNYRYQAPDKLKNKNKLKRRQGIEIYDLYFEIYLVFEFWPLEF